MSLLSIEELQRLIELAGGQRSGADMVMLVDNAGTIVEGEAMARVYPDGKSRLAIAGWYWGQSAHSESGAVDAARHLTPLTVVRQADAASGSLAILASNRTRKISANISLYRSGGDSTVVTTEPLFEVNIGEAQIVGQYFLTGSDATLKEVLVFSYRSVQLKMAPQKITGSRGAVREVTITTGSGV